MPYKIVGIARYTIGQEKLEMSRPVHFKPDSITNSWRNRGFLSFDKTRDI